MKIESKELLKMKYVAINLVPDPTPEDPPTPPAPPPEPIEGEPPMM